MFNKIVPQLWMLQPKEIRDKVAQDLQIPRTGITEIRDQDIISDGYCQADLDHLTEAKMEDYVGSKESFSRLWELTVMKAHSELHPPEVFIGTAEQLAGLREVSNEEFNQLKVEPKKKKAK